MGVKDHVFGPRVGLQSRKAAPRGHIKTNKRPESKSTKFGAIHNKTQIKSAHIKSATLQTYRAAAVRLADVGKASLDTTGGQ